MKRALTSICLLALTMTSAGCCCGWGPRASTAGCGRAYWGDWNERPSRCGDPCCNPGGCSPLCQPMRGWLRRFIADCEQAPCGICGGSGCQTCCGAQGGGCCGGQGGCQGPHGMQYGPEMGYNAGQMHYHDGQMSDDVIMHEGPEPTPADARPMPRSENVPSEPARPMPRPGPETTSRNRYSSSGPVMYSRMTPPPPQSQNAYPRMLPPQRYRMAQY